MTGRIARASIVIASILLIAPVARAGIDRHARQRLGSGHQRHLRFQTVDKGARSCWTPPTAAPVDRPHLLAFRDEESWNAFWVAHSCGREAPRLAIGFPERMAVAYVAGEAAEATSAEIEEILYDRAAEEIVVRVEEERAPVASPVRFNPFHVVACRNVPGSPVLRREVAWPFRTLEIGEMSGYRYGDPGFGGESAILRDEKAWLELWEKHASLRDPVPAPPAVDSTREMVLAAFFGHWPTNGASVEIVRITQTWFGALRVEVARRAEPGLLDVITSPFHLAAAPVFAGPVYFVERPPR